MRALLLLAMLAPLAGCASTRNAALRSEIAALQGEVGGIEAAIEASTSTPGALARHLHSRISYDPLIAWADQFSQRPPGERTVRFRQDIREGYIARKKFNCPFGANGGWYVEFDSSDATRADMTIERFQLIPAAGGIDISAPLQISLRSQIHGHFDPCIGGGVGTSVGLSADKGVPAKLALRFGAVTGGKLPYSLDLVDPRTIKVTVEVHLGKIGTIGIPIEMTDVARSLGQGSIDLLFRTDGRLGPLPDGRTFTYRLQTVSPNVRTTAQALELDSDLEVVIEPSTG